MTFIQKFFTAIFPRKWAEDMRIESQKWMIRCTGCNKSISVWDAGGIRWRAKSKGKYTLVRCPNCGLHGAAVEKTG